MEEEARRPAPWKVISATLIAGVVILASLSAYLFLRPEAEEIVPICPTNYEWDSDSSSCILSDTFAPTGVSAVNRETAFLGEVLTFNGGGSTDDEAVTQWTWDFGDGSGGTGKTVAKAYFVPGDYIISLTVKDAAGNEGTNEALFTRVKVLNPPAPERNETEPVALLAVDQDVIETGDEVFADGNGSWQWEWNDANGFFDKLIGSDYLTFDYDFGDGATASGSNVTHTYTSSGNYALRLTATGDKGYTAFAIHTIHVLVEPAAYVGEIKNPDTLIMTTIAEGEHMDPGRAYDSASGDILRSVYEYLVFWDRDSLSTLVPQLATVVPTVLNGGITPDGLTYTFTIRQGVKFHNGDTLDAYDVEYSLERNMISDFAGGPMWLILEPILGPGIGSLDADALTDAELLENVTKIRDAVVAVDQWTVDLTLDFAFPPFLGMLSGWGVQIMNKDYMINELDQWPMTYDVATIREYNRAHDEYAMHGDEPGEVVGTGPYEFKSWDPDVHIVLERFDDYWQGPADIKFVVVKNVPEWGTRKLMFLNGDTDFVAVPRPFREQVIGVEGVRSIAGLADLALAYGGFNLDIGNVPENPDIGSGLLNGQGIPTDFFADQNIRRAFSWLFDYDTYLEDAIQGLGEQAFGPIPRGLLGYTDTGPKYALDLVKAEAEFKASAFMPDLWDLGFKFTMLYNEGNVQRQVAAEIVRDNLAAINSKFIVDIKSVPWGEYLGRLIAGTITLGNIGWGADYPDPHNFAHPFMRSGAGAFAAWFSYENATVDQWIDDAGSETDPAVREQLYFDIQEANFWDPPGIWLYQPLVDHFERTWIQGWYYNAVTTYYYYDYTKG
ncbi:MAG: ABC transporter substrate-binding protein [Candidatus Thermoplasmatota archaeon]|nr:ABC transporter substrate-binding protein [Candidatus Thermoplasmatota archaeon]